MVLFYAEFERLSFEGKFRFSTSTHLSRVLSVKITRERSTFVTGNYKCVLKQLSNNDDQYSNNIPVESELSKNIVTIRTSFVSDATIREIHYSSFVWYSRGLPSQLLHLDDQENIVRLPERADSRRERWGKRPLYPVAYHTPTKVWLSSIEFLVSLSSRTVSPFLLSIYTQPLCLRFATTRVRLSPVFTLHAIVLTDQWREKCVSRIPRRGSHAIIVTEPATI